MALAERESEPNGDPEPPRKLKVASEGYFEPGALLQIWAYGAHQGDARTQFLVRRAEFRASGAIVPARLRYKVMIDPAKALEFNTDPAELDEGQPAAVVIKDVAATWVSAYADVSVGQFKNPLSYEGSGSSSKLLLPERAAVSRHYGDKRDIGVQAEKKVSFMRYALGAFNGEGPNRPDVNNQKDVALRLELFPIEGLLVGAVGYMSVGEREEPTTKDRLEADVRLDMANVLIQAEYLHGWDGSTDAARTEGHGFYAAAGYTIAGKLQPVVRVGYLDPNLDADGAAGNRADEAMIYELGVNYFVAKDFAKVQLSGSFFDYDDGDDVTEFILSTQLSY